MRIVRRQTCEAKFCSFLRFEHHSSITTTQWVKDHELARNFNNQFHSIPEIAILQHLQTTLKHHPENTLAFKHLCAYLQEPCYWVAYWFICNYSLPNQFHSSLDDLIQVFKIAEAETLKLDKLVYRLRQYNPQRSQFKTYVQKWLKSAIADAIYTEYRIAKYTDWGLLKNSSATAVRTALSQKGYTQEQIQNYQMAVEFFKSVNAKNQPDAQEFEVTVTLYNQQDRVAITSNQLKQWLNKCIQALRQYEQQKCPHHYASSLSVTESNQEEKASCSESHTFVTPQSESENSLPATSEEVKPFLEEALTHLTLEETHILFLHYGLNVQQSELAILKEVNQSSISRKINKLHKKLAQIVTKPLLEKKQMKLNYKTLPKEAVRIMSYWLELYFKQPIFEHLAEIFQVHLNEFNQTCIRFIYGGNYDGDGNQQLFSLEEVANELNLSMEQLETNLTQSQQILEQGIVTLLQEKEINPLVIKQQNISDLVEEWLRENAIYSLLTSPKKQT